MPFGEDLHEEPEEGPKRLDRKTFFDLLKLSTLAEDVLAKVADDAQFETLLERARLRVLSVFTVLLSSACCIPLLRLYVAAQSEVQIPLWSSA